MKIIVLGVGPMGRHISKALKKKGYDVFDRQLNRGCIGSVAHAVKPYHQRLRESKYRW